MHKREEGFIEVPGGKVWYCSCGDGPLTPFIALHGGPGANSHLQHVFEALATDRRVIYYDQLGGTGKSDQPQDPSLYTIERYVEELHCIRQALQLDHLHIHGQSWGSILATAYALKYPQGIKSIMLSSPAINIPLIESETLRLMKAMPKPYCDILIKHQDADTTDSIEYIDAFIEFNRRHFTYDENMLSGMRDNLINGVTNIVQETMLDRIGVSTHGTLSGLDLSDQLHKLSAPLLFACGRFDKSTPELTAAAHAQVEEAEMHVFEDSAHFPQISETEAYLRCIDTFIRKHD